MRPSFPLAAAPVLFAIACGTPSAPSDGTSSSGDASTSAGPPASDAGGSSGGGDHGSSTAADTAMDPDDDGGSSGATDVPNDTPLPLEPCPVAGEAAIVAPAGCFVFTPADAGAVHGDLDTQHIALEPGATATGTLVVHFAASLSTPALQIASPEQNLYTAAALEGHHVLALAYRNDHVIGAPNACGNDAACYPATRETILRGVAVEGADHHVEDIEVDEGIVARLDAALALLAERRPGEGWDAFRDADGATAEDRIVWADVIATGHSQGGGHAAWLGRSFAIRRVVQLASTCDAVDDAPAPWTFADASWATAPSSDYYGFASANDQTICPMHVAVWTAMGQDPARSFDDAAGCNGGSHVGPALCDANFERWRELVR